MTSKDFVRMIERELTEQGISKGQFYKDCGLSSAVFSSWRSGENQPSARNIKMISEYLGISVDDDGVPQDDETLALRELLRDRQDLRILLNSAKDAPASSVYTLIAQIEKMKEEKG